MKDLRSLVDKLSQMILEVLKSTDGIILKVNKQAFMDLVEQLLLLFLQLR